MKDRPTATKAVIKVIMSMPKGFQFHGYDLKNMVCLIYSDAQNMYPDTLMRLMRRSCHNDYRTVSRNKSLFERI